MKRRKREKTSRKRRWAGWQSHSRPIFWAAPGSTRVHKSLPTSLLDPPSSFNLFWLQDTLIHLRRVKGQSLLICPSESFASWMQNWGVLVHSGFYNKHTVGWRAYKQQTFISQRSQGWKVQGCVPGRFSVWWRHISWFIDGCLHCVTGQRGLEIPVWSRLSGH